MSDIREERLVVSIATLAGIACILENYLGGWETWVPLVVLLGIIAMWWLHIAQKIDIDSRVLKIANKRIEFDDIYDLEITES